MNPPIRQFDNQSIGLAPGRLDVMGGIADYSGSLLLQMPIAERTEVRLTKRDDGLFRIESDMEDGIFEIPKHEITGIHYREIGRKLQQQTGGHWAAYVAGCFSVLQAELGLAFDGADLRVQSQVPVGKGVSSSAALEVAAMHAISRAYRLSIDPIQLAVLAQKVENLVVGASCGLMDQLAVNLGRKDHLLPIICQPHEVFDPLSIPAGIRFYGLDSCVRHAVSNASYGDVRTAAFMAFTVAMMESGVPKHALMGGDLPYGGFLANISPEAFHGKYMGLIPEQISGAAFLDTYGVHIDAVTEVDPSKTYYLRRSALHPVMENARIRKFMSGLQALDTAVDRAHLTNELGALMLESHQGYVSIGLGEPVTSRIVELVRAKGRGHGIPGARISGGGSGGTVVVMVSSDEGIERLMDIKAEMEKQVEKELTLFEGSSEGAHYIN